MNILKFLTIINDYNEIDLNNIQNQYLMFKPIIKNNKIVACEVINITFNEQIDYIYIFDVQNSNSNSKSQLSFLSFNKKDKIKVNISINNEYDLVLSQYNGYKYDFDNKTNVSQIQYSYNNFFINVKFLFFKQEMKLSSLKEIYFLFEKDNNIKKIMLLHFDEIYNFIKLQIINKTIPCNGFNKFVRQYNNLFFEIKNILNLKNKDKFINKIYNETFKDIINKDKFNEFFKPLYIENNILFFYKNLYDEYSIFCYNTRDEINFEKSFKNKIFRKAFAKFLYLRNNSDFDFYTNKYIGEHKLVCCFDNKYVVQHTLFNDLYFYYITIDGVIVQASNEEKREMESFYLTFKELEK